MGVDMSTHLSDTPVSKSNGRRWTFLDVKRVHLTGVV